MGLYHTPQSQEEDSSGNPLNGAKLFFYEVGTTTKKAIYQDKAMEVPHTNPVVANSAGRFDPIYTDGAYKVVLTTSDDTDPPTAPIWTEDNLSYGTGDIFSETEVITATTSIDSTYDRKHIRVTGTTSLNLLDLATAGEGFAFSVRNDGVGMVTIDPNASEQINDTTTWVIPPGGGGLCIAGEEWSFVGTMGIPQTTAVNDLLYLDANKKMAAGKSLAGDYTFTGKLLTPDKGELTIATGAITVTGLYHTIDTEADAATDDLVTVNGGADGQTLDLRIENDARTIVIKNTGNIDIPEDFTLSSDNQIISLKYDGALSKWLQVSATIGQVSALYAAMKGRILNGLRLSNGTDATNDIDIAAGSCASDDGTVIITLSAITKRLDAAWAAGTGNGGLDTGSIANTTYHMWAISKAGGLDPDVLFSTSASSPTMPATYTKKARIGSIVRASAAILGFVQTGNRFIYKTPILDVNTTFSTSPANTAVSLPAGLKVVGLFDVYLTKATSTAGVFLNDPDAGTSLTPSQTAAPLATYWAFGNGSNTSDSGGQAECVCNTSSQIAIAAGAATTTVRVSTRGWIDNLGMPS